MSAPVRDLIGYGGRPPAVRWPNGAKLAVSVALNFEEGAESSIEAGDAAGESIGVQKVGGPALPILWATLEAMRDSGDTGGYYEDAFQRMMQAGVIFQTVSIGHHEWTEIDDLADLEDARARVAR